MGKTLALLADSSVGANQICDTRCVVECCETFHIHWKNLRLELSRDAFSSLSEVFAQIDSRHNGQGLPQNHEDAYVDLGRFEIPHAAIPLTDLKVELCANTFRTQYQSETTFDDSEYIHIHYRDLRIELTVREFRMFAANVAQAATALDLTGSRDLTGVFRSLNEARVRYAIVRNWDRLEEGVRGGEERDVDVLVHEDDFESFLHVTLAHKERLGEKKVMYRVPVVIDGKSTFVYFDAIASDSGYYPRELSLRMLEGRTKYAEYFVLNPHDHYDSLLYHMAFLKRSLRHDYRQTLLKLGETLTTRDAPLDLASLAAVRNHLEKKGIRFELPHDRCVVPWKLPDGDLCLDRQILRSAWLCELEGEDVWSRVYKTAKNTIVKEASAPFATHEFSMLSALNSEYFPKVLGLQEEDGWGSIEMEWLDGAVLTHWDALIELDNATAADEFIRHCLNILQELRANLICHRDIHAGNLIVCGGAPRLIDFAWATTANADDNSVPRGFGTDCRAPDGSFCDVYAMGTILRELVRDFSQFDDLVKLMTDESQAERVRVYVEGPSILEKAARESSLASGAAAFVRTRTRRTIRAVKHSQIYQLLKQSDTLVRLKEKYIG